MSVAPSRASATIDSHGMVETPNSTVKTPNSATKTNMTMPAWSRIGWPVSQTATSDRADAGRGAQQAEPPGPEFEDVAGIDRQQRHRAGQKHGEEVERDRAEHDLLAPDVAEAGKQRVEASACRSARAAPASGSRRSAASRRPSARRRCRRPIRPKGRRAGRRRPARRWSRSARRTNSRPPRWRNPPWAPDWRPARPQPGRRRRGRRRRRRARRRSGRRPVSPRQREATAAPARTAPRHRSTSPMIRRRPKRSETAPVTSTRSSEGRNWTMPTSPRSNGSRVRS